MSRVMMMLGSYPFSVETAAYEKLTLTTPHRWAALERLGARPVLQHLGVGVESVELNGRVYPAWNGGLWQVDALRALAGTGQPQLLMDGLFVVWGRYVIREVEETQPQHFEGGAPRRQDFRLGLARYPDTAPLLADGSTLDAVSGLSDRARAWTAADLEPGVTLDVGGA